MAANRTYGIPHIIESREIFTFNGGQGKLPIRFTGGITDPKFDIPATYTTSNPFEQLVIEGSSQFGKRVFRYGQNGEVLNSEPVQDTVARVESSLKTAKETGKKGKGAAAAPADDSKTYPNVETIGEATEILLDLGAKADELTTPESVISTMLKMKVSFPNLNLNI